MDTSAAPLKPFAPPVGLEHFLPAGLSVSMLGGWLVLLILAVWALYTIVVIYHWIRYSHAALIALPAIFVHLAVSGILILFALPSLAGA